MEHGKVLFEQTDGIALITLNDPASLNSWGTKLRADFTSAMDRVEAEGSGVRCIILTGAGRGFSAGANLNDPDAPPRDRAAEARGEVQSSLESFYNPMFLRLRSLDVPVVAAVNGVAAGVGMSFALSADYVVAAKSAYFLQAFARIGLVPDGGSTYVLPRLIGLARAMELSMMADKLPAEKAYDWGLINQVVADNRLMEEASSVAQRFADGPRSLGMIRRMYWQSLENDYATQLQLESDYQTEAGQTRDHEEGVSAFLEKRTAKFTGE